MKLESRGAAGWLALLFVTLELSACGGGGFQWRLQRTTAATATATDGDAGTFGAELREPAELQRRPRDHAARSDRHGHRD